MDNTETKPRTKNRKVKLEQRNKPSETEESLDEDLT